MQKLKAQGTKGENKLLLHPSFDGTISALKKGRIKLPRHPVEEDLSLRLKDPPRNETRLMALEDEGRHYNLDAGNGAEIAQSGLAVSAYDESINRFSALEGSAYFTSHSLALLGPDRYLPVNYLTFYFYTRSKSLQNASPHLKYAKDPGMASQIDYIKDRIEFLVEYTPDGSVLFIDGPLIAGDVYVRMIGAMDTFHEKNLFPAFFIKNSNSNLVTDNTSGLRGKYNSDLHWANVLLKPGQRSSFFKYVDVNNPRNAKVFCYFKTFRSSPLRIEFHLDTYEREQNRIPSIMDLVHYYGLVQGDARNPQIRPIAIAEKFARATLRLVDFDRIMRAAGATPTINQERFAW